MNRYVEYLLSLPKSIYLNFKVLPFKEAVRLPLLVRYNTVLSSCSGIVTMQGGAKTGSVKIGFGHVGCFDKKYERSIWEVSGKLLFEGRASFGHGSRILVGDNGTLCVGDKFVNTAGITIICFLNIRIGKNVLTSWETLIMDTDFHKIRDIAKGDGGKREKAVVIGNHVWIGCRATILKGTQIFDDSVIAAGAVVSKKIESPSVLIAGNPALVKKTNVTWEL